VRNSGGVSCPACTLREAITQSLNTTFYGLAYEVGPPAVAETIRAVTGLPDTWQSGNLEGKPTLASSEGGTTGSAIGIGEYEMRPIDQAHGFATLAAGGVERDPFFVSKVVDSEGTVLLERTETEGEQVLSGEIANDVTYALTDVADYSGRELDEGREVAAKTGTQGLDDENNSDAWIVGYTPSLSTAVWIGTDAREPIVNSDQGIIYGAGLPGAIWQQFMNRVLAGTPLEDLPDEPLIDGVTGEGVPEPEPVITEALPPPTEVAAPTTEAPAPTSEAPVATSQAPVTTSQAAPTSTSAAPTSTSQASGAVVPPSSTGAGRPSPRNG
jgi:membrane peptidoglycan carboxypeptidase